VRVNEDGETKIVSNDNCWELRYQPPLPADQVKPMVEFDYEGGVPSICDIYELIISAHLFAFLLKFVDSCEEFSGPSSTGCG
jgi:hypothetical protein